MSNKIEYLRITDKDIELISMVMMKAPMNKTFNYASSSYGLKQLIGNWLEFVNPYGMCYISKIEFEELMERMGFDYKYGPSKTDRHYKVSESFWKNMSKERLFEHIPPSLKRKNKEVDERKMIENKRAKLIQTQRNFEDESIKRILN